MTRFALSPYYHPTTVCFVDDNQSFLLSLDLELPEYWTHCSFVDPEEALQYLNREPLLPPLVDRCFSIESGHNANPVIHLEMGMIEQEINHLERFARTSVAVIDYAMPSLDGLELCARLTDPYLQKAMLTGVADEKVAVAAFNEGLIDRFSAKHKLASTSKIIEFVDALKHVYFSQHTARLRNNLALDPPLFLLDQRIAHEVQRLMSDRKLIEYYLVTDPPGLLLLDAPGNLCRLLIADEAMLSSQLEFARQHAAPSTVIDALAQRRQLAYLWDTPDNYFGNEEYPWEEHLLPATVVEGDRRWYLALAEDPPTDIDFDPAKSSFNAYLRSLSAG
ncbi:MAG: hypothetical protein ACR2PZ_21350 [Pseudomonadales bacterium]